MHLSIIVAADQNNGIGRDGNQPFFISNDLKRFKALTTGHTILMGRKTFEALPKGALPNRRNIVLTHDPLFNAPGIEVLYDLEPSNALSLPNHIGENERVFVIGGGTVYQLFLPFTQTIYLTRVHHAFEGIDTWFPVLDDAKWAEKERQGPFSDEKSGLSYSYVTLNRIR